jgi:hypothetical protein
MTTWNRVQGDVGDTIVVTLNGVADLAAVTAVEAHVWRGATVATLTAAVTDADELEVTVELGDDEGWLATAAAGAWRFETQATFADGSILTWPSSGTDHIKVRAQGDE